MNPSSEYRQTSKFEKYLRLTIRQVLLQLALIFIGLTVIFPILWIITLATDERGLPQYSDLNIIPNPSRFSLNAFETLLLEPFATLSSATNELYFTQLLSNSLFVALGTAMLSVGLGASAAYAFSRFKFIGRQAGMLGFIVLLMMPATGTIVPLIAIFSLFRIHVVFSALAPAVFYGALAALIAYGIYASVRSLFNRPIFQDRQLIYIPFVITILLAFGLIYVGWSVRFYTSDVYSEVIRDPMRFDDPLSDDDIPDIEAEIDEIQREIPKIEDNIIRQERRLEDARSNIDRARDGFGSVEEQFRGAYGLFNELSRVSTIIGQATTPGGITMLESVYDINDIRAVVVAGLEAEAVDQEVVVEEEKENLENTLALLEQRRNDLAEAEEPYNRLRDDAFRGLIPYALLTLLLSAVVAAVVWFLFTRQMFFLEPLWNRFKGLFGGGQRSESVDFITPLRHGSLARRDRIAYAALTVCLFITVLVAYQWFDANYESPTKAAGLEDGGLWYDLRLSLRSEDEILDELAPYMERDELVDSLETMQGQGIADFREQRSEALSDLSLLIAELERVDVSLDAPDNLTRREKIDWRDNRREDLRSNGWTETILLPVEQADSLVNDVTYSSQDDAVVVTGVTEGSPAYQSGLRSGDRLEVVNAVEVTDQALDTLLADATDTIAVTIYRRPMRAIQSDAQAFIGTTNRLNLFNNENFRTELLSLMRKQRGSYVNELEYSATEDLSSAEANFQAAIGRLPDDTDERERLEKEYAIRSSNSGNVTETLKITLFGLMIAYSSAALPFAIWNLKGYFDTIPKELEEAALVDGATLVSSFFRIILPLSLPALAITTLFGFMTGWTEFILAFQFLTAGDVDRTTLAMALRGIAGGGQTQAEPNYTQFAAMSILMAIPVVSLFYVFQRWIVSGLTVGGVKG